MVNQSGVEIKGTEAILDRLEAVGVNIKRAKKNALKRAGEVVEKQLEKNTPRSDKHDIHMKEHVVKSNVRIDGETGGEYIAIGYPKGIKHRVHVVEFGTINQSPQGFMSKTMQETKSEVRKVIMDELKGALK
ncbi:HK97-gp10 family putative phage morphogenesis protein [Macrococcus capreoli]|uniref:HK97-gp10 family putative phage morphogenesis protein n=1 Tax=Macrococcus capreoli TaxID=2982690 RepID=UPI0021D5DBC5|nr:HK97-gp10 family putative phage morphogenesis protein [Macrococcus sp. TMW 2.2395]MCU7557257.1 HK97 gp10 family phage protein [Macrococcus sp. TMW 2.2395]